MLNMLGDALREYSELRHQLDENLLDENGAEWSEELKRFLRKEPTWGNGQLATAEPEAQDHPVIQSLLELVDSAILVSATTARFVAKDRFKLKKDGGICSYLGDNFKAWFLKGEGKIEEPFVGSTICSKKLLQNSLDGPIITELGGQAKAETTLTEMFSEMAKQPSGGEGALLNNGWWNIFYIRDLKGVLRAVGVRWRGGGWCVGADSVKGPLAWVAGFLVFSRNSVLKSSGTSVSAQA